MFDNTTLEQYSVLEELSSVTPVWRPFAHHHVEEAQVETLGTEESVQ